MRKLWTLVLVMASIGAPEAAAQDAALAPGARVRVTQVTSPGGVQRGATQIGTLESVDSSSITVNVNGQTLVYPRDIIARVEVSAGRADLTRAPWRGAKQGAQIGAATMGLVVGLAVYSSGFGGDEDVHAPAPGTVIVWLLAIGTAVGGVLGFTAGSIPQEQWVPVWRGSTPVSLSIDPAPSGGTSVGLSLRF